MWQGIATVLVALLKGILAYLTIRNNGTLKEKAKQLENDLQSVRRANKVKMSIRTLSRANAIKWMRKNGYWK